MNDELLRDLGVVLCKYDENGLSLTQASLHVLISVLTAIDEKDERWGRQNLPGAPSVTDYAASVIEHLKIRYATPGVML